MDKEIKRLRREIRRTLRLQGYCVENGKISLPDQSKDGFRRMHQLSVSHKIAAAEPALRDKEDQLLNFIADGSEVDPAHIEPKLVQVKPKTADELLFRYASLHWSIPVSSGYGRRLRFLVFDGRNDKLIGLFGLGDPVFAMKARDAHIGWTSDAKKRNLYHVMDAYVLGAVPPYSQLLCGKLVALLALSNEVRAAFRRRYRQSESLIGQCTRPAFLAMLTTTSAFGRSSLYNRLRYSGIEYWKPVGYTQGSGEFHFSNGTYAAIRTFVESRCVPTAKQAAWGTGFRNKREVIRKCLAEIGFSEDFLYHGVRRQVYVASLGSKSQEFLQGKCKTPGFFDRQADDLSDLFISRWLMRRSAEYPQFRQFRREAYRLWPSPETNRRSTC